MGKGNDPNCGQMQPFASPLTAAPASAAPQPHRFFHGTTPAQAASIRQRGFTGTQIFLSTADNEARDYGREVLELDVTLQSPLEIDTRLGSLPVQLEALGVPFEAQGGHLGERTVSALRARGHDALIVSYPADDSDPSSPMPARKIARILDPQAISVR
jgi:hypothetical protein